MSTALEWSQDALPLFDTAPIVAPQYAVDASIQQQYEQFHGLNPWVMDALVTLTDDYVKRGRTRIGIGMLFEVLRWHYGRTTTGDEFRLNNNFRSRYVRALIADHPEWAGMFALRELQSP